MPFDHPASYGLSAEIIATSLLPTVWLTTASIAPAPGGLRRGPNWGFRLAAASNAKGAEVRSLKTGCAAQKAGLQNGDVVLTLGHMPLVDARSIASARRVYRGGDRVEMEVSRAGSATRIEFVLAALPTETIPGCEVEYGSVASPRGHRVRTIVSRPAKATGRLPALLFVPWLSCDAVEAPLGSGDGWIRLLRGLSESSGWVVMRVEKPGVGDSEGTDCARNDLETDLDAYRAALAHLRRLDYVDSTRIVLFGGSIGGALAPMLAVEHPVAGLVISGTFSRTWLEHMLEIERRRLTLQGTAPAEVNRALRAFAEFYALYLGQGLTPGQVLERRPDLAPLWYGAPDGQYGRPASYFHQVARLNLEDAWSRLDSPVLVLYGEYDWIMSRTEHEHIVELVNARHPGLATLDVLPHTDHNLGTYDTPMDAFEGRGEGFDDSLVERVSKWLNSRVPAKGS